jgi:hypothetical protein
LGQTLRQEVAHDLLLLPSLHVARRRTTSHLSRPLGGTARGRAPPSTPALIGIGTPAPSARTEGTTISEQAPSLRHAIDKTGPRGQPSRSRHHPSSDDRYDGPPSKYGPTGWAYGPTHYGMCNIQSRHTWPRSTLPRSSPTCVAIRLSFHPRFTQNG